jgi:hypothetical protein
MFKFDTIKEFIEILYKERKVIDFLFKKRKRTVSVENLLSFIEYNIEKIDYLLDEDIIIKSGNTIELNDELNDFFEKFINATEEINNEYTDGLISDLKTKTEIFTEEKRPEKKDEYLLKIKNSLRKIGKNIIGNINQIRTNIEDVYATEKNYKIKIIKLNEYSRKANQIEELINNITKLLKSNDWEYFVKIAEDNVLEYIITDLRKDISLAWINFGDITQKIIDFHNQIRLQSDFYKKIQKIKRLKDKHILSENSNIERILIQENSLFFSEQQKFISQISIPFLQTDEAYQLIFKTNWSFKKLKQGVKQQLAEEISGNQFVKKQKTIIAISPAKIKQLFTASGGELFDFIQNYEFSESLSLEQKTTLFCKIASRYNDELGHTGEYNISDGIEYAVIKEKNRL